MSGHVVEHCAKPRTFMRKIGATWVCDCGKVYKLRWSMGFFESHKRWEYVGHMDQVVPTKADAIADVRTRGAKS